MIVDGRYVHASNVSEAWTDALTVGLSASKGVHLVLRIDQPDVEDPNIRERADRLQRELEGVVKGDKYKPIDTVRNTVFPEPWARRRPEPADLAEHYRQRYPQLRQHRE